LAQKRKLGFFSRKSFSAEIYGTAGNKVVEAINRTVFPYKIFKTNLVHRRV